MSKRPFLVMGMTSFFAALLLKNLSLTVVLVVAALAAAVTLVAAFVPVRREVMKPVALAAACVLLTTGLFAVRELLVVRPLLAFDGASVTVTARVEESLGDSAYMVSVETGDLPAGTKLALWTNDGELACDPGDLLSGSVSLTAAFENNSFVDGDYARAQGTYLYAWADDKPLLWQDGSDSLPFPQSWLLPLREAIHNKLYTYLDSAHASLCESMLLGNRDRLPETVATAFRESGVYHLLVVSGLHLSVVTGAILWLLRKMGVHRRLRAGLAMLGVVGFMLLCGFSPSVVRAGVMTLLMLFGILLRREADGLNSLGAAAFVMLLADPFCIYDLGMQLSFAATLGLLTLFPVWERTVSRRVCASKLVWHRLLRPVVSAVGVTLCASLTTMPLTALYFHQISLLFLPANLLCVLPASLLLIVSFAALLIPSWWVLEYAVHAVLRCAQLLGDWLFTVTHFLSSLPLSTLTTREPYLIVWLFAVAVLLPVGYALCRWRGVWRMLSMLCCVLVCGVASSRLAMMGVTTVNVAASETAAFTLTKDGQTGLVFSGDSKALKETAYLLRDEGMNRLQWVLWLNEPSVQTMDLSPLTAEIGELYVTSPPENYTQLPQAAHTTCLSETDRLSFWQNGTLTMKDGFCRLTVGDTAMLLCPEAGNALTLPADWLQADMVFYQTVAPAHATAITADEGVWFCKRGDTALIQKAVPCGSYEILTPVCDGAQALMTRGRGDVCLRWY